MKVAAFVIESDDAEIYGLESLYDGVRLSVIWHIWSRRIPLENSSTEQERSATGMFRSGS